MRLGYRAAFPKQSIRGNHDRSFHGKQRIVYGGQLHVSVRGEPKSWRNCVFKQPTVHRGQLHGTVYRRHSTRG
jgi:hypothetical protein